MASPEVPREARSVLVADDEPLLLRLIERVLEGARYPVVAVSDGAQALRSLEQRRDEIGVLVLDAAIPPRGAGEIVEAALKQLDAPGMVLMSGDVLDPPLDALLLEHDGVFLRKPFAPDALLRAVEDSLVKEAG